MELSDLIQTPGQRQLLISLAETPAGVGLHPEVAAQISSATQLVNRGLAAVDDNHHYIITDCGRQLVAAGIPDPEMLHMDEGRTLIAALVSDLVTNNQCFANGYPATADAVARWVLDVADRII
jgi:hypothetical protein